MELEPLTYYIDQLSLGSCVLFLKKHSLILSLCSFQSPSGDDVNQDSLPDILPNASTKVGSSHGEFVFITSPI